VPDRCAAIQRDFGGLEKWEERNLMKFNKGKFYILYLGRSSPRHQYILGPTSLKAAPQREKLGDHGGR